MSTISPRQRKNLIERRLLLVTVLLVIVAWAYGYFNNGADVLPLAPEVLPGAVEIQPQGQLYVGLDAAGEIVGYAAVGSASGYAAPIEMLVGVDPAGEILGIKVVQQRESPGFFRLLERNEWMVRYNGRSINTPLQLGNDIDAVSGATISAEGVAASIRLAVRTIAAEGLNDPLPPEKRPIQFGWPEITLLLLYAAGFAGHKMRNRQWKIRIRWGTLIAGMVILGFIFTMPLTITMIISLLSGYWPDWTTNLYWYLLIGGILFVTTVDAKNPYCSWFCPFGAFQECLAAVSGAKAYRPRQWSEMLKWVQRGLALTAVILGLALRQPGVASYEPFDTLFDFQGTAVKWVLLLIIILASLAIYRPFCNYLCPLDPVVDFIAVVRRWVKESWAKWRPQPAKI
jgi:NosR/NirI family transcriptional regulator, nitrous oxide reductase regulator